MEYDPAINNVGTLYVHTLKDLQDILSDRKLRCRKLGNTRGRKMNTYIRFACMYIKHVQEDIQEIDNNQSLSGGELGA